VSRYRPQWGEDRCWYAPYPGGATALDADAADRFEAEGRPVVYGTYAEALAGGVEAPMDATTTTREPAAGAVTTSPLAAVAAAVPVTPAAEKPRKVARPKRAAAPDGPTHVALELRLTVAEAEALTYWLGRLDVMVDRELMSAPKGGADKGTSLDAIRRVVARLNDRQPADAVTTTEAA